MKHWRERRGLHVYVYYDLAMDNVALPAVFDPLLDYLSSHLPPQLYSIAESLLTNSYSLCSSLVVLVRTVLSNSPFQLDAQQIIPPLITLLAAYLALVSFYRTAGWMVRTAFAFVKWGFILSTLGAAAGYFLANADAGNGLGMFGGNGGLLPTIGGMLLGMFNPDQQNANARRRGAGSTTAGRRARESTQRKDRPKAWESWDKHEDWQYSEQAYHQNDGGDGANVQKIIGDILGSAGRAVRESGWWEVAKGAADEFSKGARGDEQKAGANKKKDAGTKSR